MIALLNQRKTWHIYQIIACLALAYSFSGAPSTAYAKISVGLSGSGSQNNAGLEKHKSSSGSLNLSVGLGPHVKTGINYRRATEHREGLKLSSSNTSETTHYAFNSELLSTTYSLNLTLVLYNGRISPYVFGGIANKYYTNKFTYEFVDPIVHKTDFKLEEVPTYGFGIAIFLNRQFSLKITQTYSPGKVITVDAQGNEDESEAIDSYTQVGISYNLM
jgi:hypothetical protein